MPATLRLLSSWVLGRSCQDPNLLSPNVLLIPARSLHQPQSTIVDSWHPPSHCQSSRLETSGSFPVTLRTAKVFRFLFWDAISTPSVSVWQLPTSPRKCSFRCADDERLTAPAATIPPPPAHDPHRLPVLDGTAICGDDIFSTIPLALIFHRPASLFNVRLCTLRGGNGARSIALAFGHSVLWILRQQMQEVWQYRTCQADVDRRGGEIRMGTDYRGDVNHGDAGRNKNEPLWEILDLEGRTLKECATRNSKPQLDVARLRNSD